jgi:hypothetical protein
MATAASQSFSLTAGHRRLGAKLVGAVLSLAFVLVFNFFLFRVPPGDPAKNLTRNRLVPAEQVQVLCESFGLGKPLHEQFISYVGDTLRGDLGISYKFRRPVSEVVAERIWPTVLLLGVSTMLSTVIGLWIGIKGAWQRGSVFDRVSLGASLGPVRHARVLARDPAADRLRGRGRVLPGAVPDRGTVQPQHRAGQRGRVVGRGQTPVPALPHPHPGLHRRVRAGHALVAARRAGPGLSGHGQGPRDSGKRWCCGATPCPTPCCPPPR